MYIQLLTKHHEKKLTSGIAKMDQLILADQKKYNALKMEHKKNMTEQMTLYDKIRRNQLNIFKQTNGESNLHKFKFTENHFKRFLEPEQSRKFAEAQENKAELEEIKSRITILNSNRKLWSAYKKKLTSSNTLYGVNHDIDSIYNDLFSTKSYEELISYNKEIQTQMDSILNYMNRVEDRMDNLNEVPSILQDTNQIIQENNDYFGDFFTLPTEITDEDERVLILV